MKKYLSILLLISLLLVSMVSCNNIETPQNNPSETTATNSDSTPVFTDPIKDYDIVDDSSTEGFTIKAKKYNYEDNNVLLLNVKNTTNTNYSVSVNVDFCDSTGNTVKTESQTLEGYAAGYEKLFLFEPQITFDNYTYKVTVEEYTGECYAPHVDVRFGEISESLVPSPDMVNNYGDFTKYPAILMRCYYKNSSNRDLKIKNKFIITDNTGKIFTILPSAITIIKAETNYNDSIDLTLLQVIEGDLVWPEELKGDVSGICVIENVALYKK